GPRPAASASLAGVDIDQAPIDGAGPLRLADDEVVVESAVDRGRIDRQSEQAAEEPRDVGPVAEYPGNVARFLDNVDETGLFAEPAYFARCGKVAFVPGGAVARDEHV